MRGLHWNNRLSPNLECVHVSSLFINAIKVYRTYDCRPHSWLTVTVVTATGHKHNTTNPIIQYSRHYTKGHFPFTDPFLPPANAGLSPTTLNLFSPRRSLHPVIIDFCPRDVCHRPQGMWEEGPPLFPLWQLSHSVTFCIHAEAGACNLAAQELQTSCWNDGAKSIVAIDTTDFTSGRTNNSERICILAF